VLQIIWINGNFQASKILGNVRYIEELVMLVMLVIPDGELTAKNNAILHKKYED
jgi:hypothetical protein